MNTKKQNSNQKLETPNSKLQKSSVIFMQLGLIITLLAVYFTLEHKSMIYATTIIDEPMIELIDEPYVMKFRIEEPKIKIPKTSKIKQTVITKKPIENINLIENSEPNKTNNTILEPIDEPLNTESKKGNYDNIPDEPIELTEKSPVIFKRVEQAPEFPGCNKGSKAQKIVCFNKKMGKHVNKYFDVDLAQDLGLSPGRKRINVQFIIDEKGNITDIKSNASHIKLQKEAIRIVKKLPKMIPGKQRNTPVKVKFNLPINFNVVD